MSQEQLNAFLRKTKIVGIPSDFGEVIHQVKAFVYPVYERLLKEDDVVKKWNCEMNAWV